MMQSLTERQKDVARLALQGKGTKEIAEALGSTMPVVSREKDHLYATVPGIQHAMWLARKLVD